MKKKVLIGIWLIVLMFVFSGCAGMTGYRYSNYPEHRFIFGNNGDSGYRDAGAISIGQR